MESGQESTVVARVWTRCIRERKISEIYLAHNTILVTRKVLGRAFK